MDEAFLEEGTKLVTWVCVKFFLFFGLYFMLFLLQGLEFTCTQVGKVKRTIAKHATEFY